jgi:hypothetical protein
MPGRFGEHALRASPVAHVPAVGGRMLLVAEMLGELLVQRCLQHRLGQLLQQPVRARQRQTLLLGLTHQLSRSLQLRRLSSRLLLLAHLIKCRGHHRPFPPASRRASQAGNTVRSTAPRRPAFRQGSRAGQQWLHQHFDGRREGPSCSGSRSTGWRRCSPTGGCVTSRTWPDVTSLPTARVRQHAGAATW